MGSAFPFYLPLRAARVGPPDRSACRELRLTTFARAGALPLPASLAPLPDDAAREGEIDAHRARLSVRPRWDAVEASSSLEKPEVERGRVARRAIWRATAIELTMVASVQASSARVSFSHGGGDQSSVISFVNQSPDRHRAWRAQDDDARATEAEIPISEIVEPPPTPGPRRRWPRESPQARHEKTKFT
jgi:hypothetical protein